MSETISHLGDIRKWSVVAAMFGTPCTSFTVATDRTCVIRSREFPYGLPGLSDRDVERVSLGNAAALSTVRVVSWLHSRHIPWCIENPHSSKLWYLPEIESLSGAPDVCEVVLDYCQFGAPWRKRTLFYCLVIVTSGMCNDFVSNVLDMECARALEDRTSN